MTVTIVGAKDFQSLRSVYSFISLPVCSETKLDTLKQLIVLAKTKKEIEYLEEKMINLGKYYKEAEGKDYKLRQRIDEVFLLFRNKGEELKRGLIEPGEKKNNSNVIIVDGTFDFSKLDNIGKSDDFVGSEDIVNTKEDNNTGFVMADGTTDFSIPNNTGILNDLAEAEDVLNKFFKAKSKREKGYFLRVFISLNISFDDLFFLYEKYRNSSARLRKVIFNKMFEKAQERKQWIRLYSISDPRNANYQIILNNAGEETKPSVQKDNSESPKSSSLEEFNYWIKEYLNSRNLRYRNKCFKKLIHIDISFIDGLAAYNSCNKNRKLRALILNKITPKVEIIEEGMILYDSVGSRGKENSEFIDCIVRTLVKRPEDIKKVKKSAQSKTNLWYKCLEKILETRTP